MGLTPSPEVRREVLAALAALDARVRARDLAGAAGLFVPDAEVLLVGSEAGEVARGPAALRRLLAGLFALPVTLGWRWGEPHVAASGAAAWLYAEAEVCVRPDGGTETRRPYRIAGVLLRDVSGWRWALFHGSEPAPADSGAAPAT